jgi:hypothetical protein
MQHKRLLMAGLALLGGGGIEVAITSAAADAQPTITLLSPVQLVDKGLGLNVSVDVVCGSGDVGGVDINVSERSGNEVTGGSGEISFFACTGSDQTMIVPVSTGTGLRPFAQGTALVTGEVLDQTPLVFETTFATATIKVVR